jgi:3-oxoacyl-[acyl-carrier protein] reductase
VRLLRESGLSVVANYLQNTARAELLARETGCELFQADVREEAEVQRLIEAHDYGAIVHCAGHSRDALLLRTSVGAWRETLLSQTESAFLVTREALRHLPNGGSLILVASRVGEHGFVGQSAYAAAKGAVLGLTRSAAREGAERGIRVNAICPGFVPSELSEQLSPEWLARRQAENLLSEADMAQAFAACVLWLLTSQAPITGQILRPDCRI